MAKFETKLLPAEETAFQAWKRRLAPKDSGEDYDLRGAFKTGTVPDPATGHWPDTFKKPNHPTFSTQSIYAKDATPVIPPAGGSIAPATPGQPLNSIPLEAQQRILGTTTSQKTAAQVADKAAFDSRFVGGQFTPSAAGRLPWAGDPVAGSPRVAAAAPASSAPLPKPTVDSIYKPTAAPAAYTPSSNVYTAPVDVQMTTPPGGPAATVGVNPTPIPGATPAILPSLPPLPTPTATPIPGATPMPSPTPGTGRTAEEGVSRSQAARIQQPTQASPMPVTPTSPVLDVNEFDKQRKKLFSGL